MKWNPQKRRYVDESGRVMREAEVRKHVDDYIAHQKQEVERKASKLLIGALTLSAFFEFLRHKITAWHSLAGSLAYGGPDEMQDEQWSRINTKILSELAYLNQFEQEAEASFRAAQKVAAKTVASLNVPAGLETLVEERLGEALLTTAPSTAELTARQVVAEVLADSVGAEQASAIASGVQVGTVENLIGATIPRRAKMYADASYSTYVNNTASRETDAGAIGVRRICVEDERSCDDCIDAASSDFVSLAEVSDIGSLQCLGNCRCYYEFSYEGIQAFDVRDSVKGLSQESFSMFRPDRRLTE